MNIGQYIYGDAIPVNTTIYLDAKSVTYLSLGLFIAIFLAIYLSKKL